MILIFRIAKLKVLLIKLEEFKLCSLDYFLQLVVCPHPYAGFFLPANHAKRRAMGHTISFTNLTACEL